MYENHTSWSLDNKIRIILDIGKPHKGGAIQIHTNKIQMKKSWSNHRKRQCIRRRKKGCPNRLSKSANVRARSWTEERGRGFTMRWSEKDQKWGRWRTKGQREHNVSHSARSCIFYDMASNLTSRMKHNSRELVRVRGKVGMSAYGLPAQANLETSKALQPNLPWCACGRAHRNH